MVVQPAEHTGISFEVVWLDEHLVEVRVCAGNGRFAATADCYADHEVFSRLAVAIQGFPTSSEDHREFLIGTFDPNCGGGGTRLLVRCVDSAGHAVAEVAVRSPARTEAGQPETASFSFPIEPAAIDEFVVALGRMQVVVGAVATLRPAI